MRSSRFPRGPLERWADREGWRASAAIGGSPGAPDPAVVEAGLQVPGDLNQDRLLDLGDAIGVLVALFLGPVALPCGGAAVGAAAGGPVTVTGTGEAYVASVGSNGAPADPSRP